MLLNLRQHEHLVRRRQIDLLIHITLLEIGERLQLVDDGSVRGPNGVAVVRDPRQLERFPIKVELSAIEVEKVRKP